MKIESSVVLDARVRDVMPHVMTLDKYVAWMPIVHRATVNQSEPTTWDVELRAKVGPLARSKRLTMHRTVCEENADGSGARAVFERQETDGRKHSPWVLTVVLTSLALDSSTDAMSARTRVDVEMVYGGNLWTGGILERVLSDSIESGKSALAELVRSA